MRHTCITRTIAWLLVSLMALGTFAACASDDAGTPEAVTTAEPISTTAAPAVIETTVPPETEPAYPYPDVTYNGAEFAILNCADRANMLYQLLPAEIIGEALSDERYKLNQRVSDRYQVTLKETQIPYNDLQSYATNEIMSNSPVHDIFYLSPPQVAPMMNSGYLLNLLEMDKLNLEEYWWDQNLLNDSVIRNRLYYAGSDYNLQPLEATIAIFFNSDMMTQLQLELPYDLVREGKWTMDKLYEYCSKAANLNGDNSFTFSANGNAVYGISSNGNMMDAFLTGCDAYYVDHNSDGEPTLTFNTEHFIDACQKIGELTSSEGLFLDGTALYEGTPNPIYIELFKNNRMLFVGQNIKAAAAESELRNMESTFGILPFPKYNEQQENYANHVYYASQYVTIPVTCSDPERASILIDTLSYETAEYVLPYYYDRVSYKGLRNQDSVDMLNIICNTRYYNWGLAYGWVSTVRTTVYQQLMAGNGNIASLLNRYVKLANTQMEKTLENFK